MSKLIKAGKPITYQCQHQWGGVKYFETPGADYQLTCTLCGAEKIVRHRSWEQAFTYLLTQCRQYTEDKTCIFCNASLDMEHLSFCPCLEAVRRTP